VEEPEKIVIRIVKRTLAMLTRRGLHRIALHSSSLSLLHRRTGAPMSFCAPVPEDLAEPLRKIGIPEVRWNVRADC